MFPEHDLDLPYKGTVLKAAVDVIVHEFVDIEYGPKSTGRMLHHVKGYAKEVLSLGLFIILNFKMQSGRVMDLECSCSYGSGKLHVNTTEAMNLLVQLLNIVRPVEWRNITTCHIPLENWQMHPPTRYI